MPLPQAFIPAKPRVRRRRRQAASSAPAPAALTLVAASYWNDPATVTLVFDRAINIAALDGPSIVVDDADITAVLYDGSGGAVLLDPVTVQITLVGIGDPTGPGVLLSASDLSGIVAVEDGGSWAGVNNVELPFP